MTRPAVPCTEPAMWRRTPSPRGKLLDLLNIESTDTESNTVDVKLLSQLIDYWYMYLVTGSEFTDLSVSRQKVIDTKVKRQLLVDIKSKDWRQ